MRIYIGIFLVLVGLNSNAQEMSVGIMRAYNLATVRVSYLDGDYQILGDSVEVTTLKEGQSIYLRRSGNSVKIEKGEGWAAV